MPSENGTWTGQSPAIIYARLLIEMHHLIRAGNGDSEEADVLADRMDGPWHAMTGEEQRRMRGLAADLNDIRQGGPQRVDMSAEQFANWQSAMRSTLNQGQIEDIDTALDFLRLPAPANLPLQFTPHLQARCWEKLGDLETALVFMREADRLDPDPVSVLLLLQQLGRVEELSCFANRIIANPAASSLELYLAAAGLLSVTLRLTAAEAKTILHEVVTALTRALNEYLHLAAEERAEVPDADLEISFALGLALERLGDSASAIDVYKEAISRHPHGGELYVARGLARYESFRSEALEDFVTAVRLSTPVIWPYLLLARHAIQRRQPGEALRLARMAENQAGPPMARAEASEIVGMALAELGHTEGEVLEPFDRALALDPGNERIRENREIARSCVVQFSKRKFVRRQRMQVLPITHQHLEGIRDEQIKGLIRLEKAGYDLRNRSLVTFQ